MARRRPRREPPPPPFEVEIHGLARSGAGVGKAPDGRVVFVPFTAPGDRARVEVTRARKRVLEARLLELLEPGPDRVEPACEVFGRCGGCQWQHVPYAAQWETKAEGVRESLRRAGLGEALESCPLDFLPAARHLGYRNRIQLHCEGEVLGFHEAGSHRLVPVAACPLAVPEVNAALPGLLARRPPGGARFRVEVARRADGSVQEAWDLPAGAGGFRQVNDEQNDALRGWVDARLGEGRTLLDLFGGAGNLARLPAARYAEVHCVDAGSPTARPRDLPANVRLHREDVGTWLRARVRERRRKKDTPPDSAAVLDPPRRGLGEDAGLLVQTLVDLGVTRVVLVSCDPDAFARDLRTLGEAGYAPDHLGIVDLFPQTRHVESLAALRRT